ncbi:MAG: GDYXXLXY domain-containing protein [Flavobacteriales bacterium]|nr:GDYXXLXY domain-containing protein [Flavobacteriales bacterium]
MRNGLLLFALIALAQLAVPGWMMVKHERVLMQGEVFRFRTAPVDPRDPFRGEYVSLEFEAERGDWSDPFAVNSSTNYTIADATGYAVLAVDDEGYAVIHELLAEPPQQGAYLRVTFSSYGDARVSHVELAFDRYYLQEGKGPRTEDLLRGDWSGEEAVEPLPAHAVVRVLNGDAVIEDLVVGDKSIQEWMNEPR